MGQRLYTEGNNGADFLDIEKLNDNLVRLRVGNCCVVTVNHVVPVELITHTLTELFLEHDDSAFANWHAGWPDEFVLQLREQIERFSWPSTPFTAEASQGVGKHAKLVQVKRYGYVELQVRAGRQGTGKLLHTERYSESDILQMCKAFVACNDRCQEQGYTFLRD